MKSQRLDQMRLLLSFLLVCFSTTAQSLQITAPAGGTVVPPGQALNVTVAASGSFADVAVGGEGKLGSSQDLNAPPYNFSIQIPATVRNRIYALTAVGFISSGQMITSTPISIDIERSDYPDNLIVQPSVLHLRVGDQASLIVTGQFDDGSNIDLTESTTTTYQSDTPTVATVTADGRVTAVRPGNAKINVSDWWVIVPVEVEPPVWIVPYEAFLYASGTSKFIAHVNIPSNTSVVWSVSPSGAGTIDSTGLYTAPSSITAPQIVIVTATSVADNTQTSSASVWLSPPISVNVSPATATMGQSQTQTFAAAVANDLNGAVSWSITPAGLGSVSGTGLYTAPSTITSGQTVTLTATSVDDATASASATVTLSPPGN